MANLRDERAHAGSLTMPDGTFWILGGAGQKKVLDTVEILNYRRYTKDLMLTIVI